MELQAKYLARLHMAQRDLQEMDIPGASLKGRDPRELKVSELKRWLELRTASTHGKKADLITR